MASAETLLKRLGDGTWKDHVKFLRAKYGKGTAKYIASKLGVSENTARRWMAQAGILGSKGSTPKPPNVASLKDLIAATKLDSGTVYPGSAVLVSSSSRSPDGKPRNIEGTTGGINGSEFSDATSYLLRGRYEDAALAFDMVVMDVYGGLGGSLYDCDYSEDFRITEE